MILKKNNRNGLSPKVLWLSKRWAQLELGPSCLALPEAKYSPRIYFWERFSSCITVGLLAAIFVLHQTESMHAKIWKDNFHAILETFKFRVAKRNLISKVKKRFLSFSQSLQTERYVNDLVLKCRIFHNFESCIFAHFENRKLYSVCSWRLWKLLTII